jgi:penicillin-binding protein 2
VAGKNNLRNAGAAFRDDRPGGRIALLGFIFIAIFAVYAVQLFRMQVLSGDLYRSKAQNIARRTTVIPAQRGEIYDRSYNLPLALNTDSFAVNITPGEVPRGEMDNLIERLSAIIKVPKAQIERKVPSTIYHLFQPVEVAVNISFPSIASLAEQVDTFPGVSWQSKPMRIYNDIGSLSHIIGYVGDITRDELTVMLNKGYKQGDVIGKMGIEKQYDEILRGREGYETRVVDVRGRRVTGENARKDSEMGKNITLTIDRKIQTLAEKALGPRIGAVIVMKPASGEILAMVSYPWYNPNIFNSSDLGSEYNALVNDANKPLLNRSIQSSYPPASTFKIIMTTGILAEGAFSPSELIDCTGEISTGDRIWHCHIGRPGHGRLNLHNAMAQSCDVYYWIVGRDHLGIENIVTYARNYGYGKAAGIDLPSESSGFIPTPQWKDRRYHERWHGGDTMNISIGQGDTLVTPLQMADMTCMVVNDGVIYKPHILQEVRDPRTGAVEQRIQSEILIESDIEKEVFAEVKKDMRGVISEGTARFPLNIKAVEIAGKTGTAEMGLTNNWHSWVTSYAPYETVNPEERVVVTVIVEAFDHWEWWGPYCSAIIYQGIFASQTYEEAVKTLGIQTSRTEGRRE